MIARSFAPVCIAVFLFTVAFAPVDATARPGGLTAHGGRHSAGRVAPARPWPTLHPGRRMVTKSLRATPIKSVHLNKHGHVVPVRRFKRFFGRDFPLSGVGDFYGAPFYGPTYDQAPYDTVVSTLVDRTTPGEEDSRRGCRSHTVVVPSQAGGERQITVTQCNQR
jgi:hypothetical protein